MTGRFPRQFGKYVLLKPMAKGGMGEIYLAAGGEVGGFEKLCVIKKVIAEKADRNKANRFLDEAKVVLRLSHAALVNTFDAGEVNGEFYIAMELVEGKDLREVWNRCVRTRQRIPLDVALHVVREVARALAYVHSYGDLKLVHRDVAPPNILLAYVGDVKLTDFGLARSILKKEHTAPGVVFGRAAYLAPEQARGEVADARTDIYTLGIVLWELLTGQQFLQLSGLDPAAALAIVRHPKPTPPSARAPWITPALDQVVVKALAPDRAVRFQTAEELRQALSTVMAEIAPTADAARVAEFLNSIYAQTISEERSEREQFLKDEIPKFRTALARGETGEAAAEGAARPAEAEARPAPALPPPIVPMLGPGEDAEALVARVHVRRSTSPRLPGMPARRGPGEGPASPPPVPVPRMSNGGLRAPFSAATAAKRADSAGVVLGRYRLGRSLAESAAGSLHAAEHVQSGAAASVRLPTGASTHAASIEAWRKDALAAAALASPQIAEVQEVAVADDGRAFAVLEPLTGTDLSSLLTHAQRLEPAIALRIAMDVAEALRAAHQRDLRHGGLRPGCVFVTGSLSAPGPAKVLDFGTTHLFSLDGGSKRKTFSGLPPGVADYLAPEQLRGAAVDARTDLHALGALLYEMLTGAPPWAGTLEALERKKQFAPQSPRMFRPDLLPEIERLVLALLDPEPGRRPASAAEAHASLAALLPVAASRDPDGLDREEQERRRSRRDAAFKVIAELVSEAAGSLAPAPLAAVGTGVPATAVAGLAMGPSPAAGARPTLGALVPGGLAGGREATKLPAPPVLGGSILARYGRGPNADPQERRRRMVKRAVIGVILAVAVAFGLARMISGEGSPPPARPASAASRVR
jgi:serine/threonine-protein kinase